jgi:hypothetical protein
MLVSGVATPCGLAGRLKPALKIEAVCFCEMLVSTYKYTQNYSSEDQHQHVRDYYKTASVK